MNKADASRTCTLAELAVQAKCPISAMYVRCYRCGQVGPMSQQSILPYFVVTAQSCHHSYTLTIQRTVVLATAYGHSILRILHF